MVYKQLWTPEKIKQKLDLIAPLGEAENFSTPYQIVTLRVKFKC